MKLNRNQKFAMAMALAIIAIGLVGAVVKTDAFRQISNYVTWALMIAAFAVLFGFKKKRPEQAQDNKQENNGGQGTDELRK